MLPKGPGIRVVKRTVIKHLRTCDIISCKKRKKALLKAKHFAARLAFAKAHIGWTNDHWSKVLWSDESRVNLYGNDGPRTCFRKRGAPLRPRDVQGTVKHGGEGLMIWGCFSSAGVGRVVPMVGMVNTDKYIRLCGPNIAMSLQELGIAFREAVFQQDNALSIWTW